MTEGQNSSVSELVRCRTHDLRMLKSECSIHTGVLFTDFFPSANEECSFLLSSEVCSPQNMIHNITLTQPILYTFQTGLIFLYGYGSWWTIQDVNYF